MDRRRELSMLVDMAEEIEDLAQELKVAIGRHRATKEEEKQYELTSQETLMADEETLIAVRARDGRATKP